MKYLIAIAVLLFAILFLSSVSTFPYSNNLVVKVWDNDLALSGTKIGIIARDVNLSADGQRITGSLQYQVWDEENPNSVIQLFVAVERKVVATIYDGIPGERPGARGLQTFSFTADLPTPGFEGGIYLVGSWTRNASRGKWTYEVEGTGQRIPIGRIYTTSSATSFKVDQRVFIKKTVGEVLEKDTDLREVQQYVRQKPIIRNDSEFELAAVAYEQFSFCMGRLDAKAKLLSKIARMNSYERSRMEASLRYSQSVDQRVMQQPLSQSISSSTLNIDPEINFSRDLYLAYAKEQSAVEQSALGITGALMIYLRDHAQDPQERGEAFIGRSKLARTRGLADGGGATESDVAAVWFMNQILIPIFEGIKWSEPADKPALCANILETASSNKLE